MGNLWSSHKKFKIKDSQIKDTQRLLLFENIDEKIEQLEQNFMSKHSNLVITYNKEIHSLRCEINDLNKKNESMSSKIRNIQVMLDSKNNIISNLETKIYNMESQDEFLSTISDDEESLGNNILSSHTN